MKRKLLSLVLCFSMVALMAVGCGKSESKTEETSKSETTQASTDATTKEATTEEATTAGDTYKVYLITMDQMDQHWVNVDAGCQKAVAELGNVDYKWLAPDVKDDAKQIECINNAVAGGANAILLAANGPDAVTSSLKEAEAAGVIYLNH